MMVRSTIIALLIVIIGCDSLSDDFFYSLFGIKGIHPERVCENNPSILSEGRFIEIYLLSESDFEKVISKIKNDSSNIPDKGIKKYGNYEQIITWRSAPPASEDFATMNILSDIKGQNFECYTDVEVIELLRGKENFYSFLEDHLKNYKLFILEHKTRKLYLLSSYQM